MTMAIAGSSQRARTHAKGLIGLIATTMVIATVAAGAWTLTHGAGDPITYSSVRTMARKIGCENTLTPAPYPGAALSAGQCTLSDGTLVDLRVYAGAGEGVAWLDGTRSGQTPAESIAGTGGSWVALVHSSDRATGNSVLEPLTTS
jgi:hypothetical protein